MLRLSLVRHAKSSWKNDLLSDHDRPLKTRGISDSGMIAQKISDLGLIPPVIFCSTALRSQLTVQLMNEIFALPEEQIRYDQVLYRAWADSILDYVKKEAKNDHIMVVGHNPGVHQLVEKLTDSRIEKFQTCAYASIVFDCNSWDDVQDGRGKLDHYIYPRMFY